jgi:hypothetical protein
VEGGAGAEADRMFAGVVALGYFVEDAPTLGCREK